MSEKSKNSRRRLLTGGALIAAGALTTYLFLDHNKPAEERHTPSPAATPSKACPQAAFEAPEKLNTDGINAPLTLLRVKVGACAAKQNITMLDTPDPNAKVSVVSQGDSPILHPGDVVDISCLTPGKGGGDWLYVNLHGRNGDDPGFVPADSFGPGVGEAILNGSTPYPDIHVALCNNGSE